MNIFKTIASWFTGSSETDQLNKIVVEHVIKETKETVAPTITKSQEKRLHHQQRPRKNASRVKPNDMSKFTRKQLKEIRAHYRFKKSEGRYSYEELARHFNHYYGMAKSRSVYTRIVTKKGPYTNS